MKITWLGHSCFHIESGDFSLVLDPYNDGQVPGYAPLHIKADAVLCSHEHGDHAARDKVELSGRPCRLQREYISCFHDEKGGKLRGTNKIHIISDGTLRIAHAGDLGHILGNGDLEALRGLDALLIPVGGYYTIDAKTANALCDMLQPRVVIPMHYRLGELGYPVLSHLDNFKNLRSDVAEYSGNQLILTPETQKQTAILRYIP